LSNTSFSNASEANTTGERFETINSPHFFAENENPGIVGY